MSHISIGGAVGAGFGLIGRKPLTVLTWGLVRILVVVGIFALYVPLMFSTLGPVMQSIQNAAAAGGTPSNTDAMSQAMMPQIMAMQGVGFLANIASLVIAAVLQCAIARSIVHPERGLFAYLRVGLPEVFFVILAYGAGLAAAFAILLCAIPFVIAVAIMAASKMTAAAIIVAALGVLLLLLVIVYVALRFAFVVPMMVDDGQFHLFDTWRLTKGHVGALFTIGLCLMLIAIAGELVVGAVVVGIGVAGLGVSAGGFDNLQAFFNLPPPTILARLGPWLAVLALLAIPIEGCVLAIFTAPWARAYRDVVPPALPPASIITPPTSPLPPADPPAAPTAPEPPIEPPIQPAPTPA